MNVASLENCKRLYELSGWSCEKAYWPPQYTSSHDYVVGTPDDEVDEKILDSLTPAYDLGYLFRKLPQESKIDKGHFQYGGDVRYHAKYSWNTELPNRKRHYATESADTPEDAACLLAVKLFEEGVLTRDTKGNLAPSENLHWKTSSGYKEGNV